MKSVIKQLYNGELYPYEKISPTGKEYQEIISKISDEMNYWKEKLPLEEFVKLEKVYDLEVQSGSLEMERAFANGFKLASLFIIEVFTETGNQI